MEAPTTLLQTHFNTLKEKNEARKTQIKGIENEYDHPATSDGAAVQRNDDDPGVHTDRAFSPSIFRTDFTRDQNIIPRNYNSTEEVGNTPVAAVIYDPAL